jgi:hypothetical protein
LNKFPACFQLTPYIYHGPPGNAKLKVVQVMIERLKVTGEQIKQLEVKKKEAVESEDYDAAKVCKVYLFLFFIF